MSALEAALDRYLDGGRGERFEGEGVISIDQQPVAMGARPIGW